SLITAVTDRPGHDRRYALDSSRLRGLGWRPEVPFHDGILRTVRWYAENQDVWAAAAGGDFARYFQDQYGGRLTAS
ncbi:MAG TPA: dTDP-glucose 4,6-dehydratase, partial [Tepidiformaceae bacterium]